MGSEDQIQFAVLSDVGYRRQNNQDSYAVQLAADLDVWAQRGHLFVVADGMGGHAVGELASKMAAETIPHMLDKLRDQPPIEAMRTAFVEANDAIHRRGSSHHEFERMGTTGSCLRLGSNGAMIGHVGDSRVYRIRKGRIDQLTRDHSLVWELIAQRKVNPKDAEKILPRNVITRSLGPDPTVEVDVEGPFWVLPGDVYLLCSDGLSSLMSDSEIAMVAATLPPDDAVHLLVNLSNLRGGLDNITVIIVRIANTVAPMAPSSSVASGIMPVGGDDGAQRAFMTIVFAFCLALMVAGGLTTFLSTQKIGGGVLLGLGLLGMGFWTWRTIRLQPRGEIATNAANPESTVVWRPYRTASARVTPQFLENLAKVQTELLSVAKDESWSIDWTEFHEADRKARVALAKKRFANSLQEFGRSIQLLMSGISEQRKKQQQARQAKAKGAV